jgi:RHS repeat-associated protein
VLWCGTQLWDKRDSTGATVSKRFFVQGEQIGGTNFFFNRDHLGSVREMTDTNGTIRARYTYDPWGRRTKVSGDLEADFGFTGHYYHTPSGLHLALYRAYDADQGRWLNRDPLEELAALIPYAYVNNNPVNWQDLMGDDINAPPGSVSGPPPPGIPRYWYRYHFHCFSSTTGLPTTPLITVGANVILTPVPDAQFQRCGIEAANMYCGTSIDGVQTNPNAYRDAQSAFHTCMTGCPYTTP